MSLGKQLVKHSAIYSMANMLSRMIGFLMIPIYTRFLSPSDYGVIEILDLTVTVVSTVIGLRITAAIYRFYYQYPGERERNLMISTALIFAFASTAATSLILNLLAERFSLVLLKSADLSKYYHIVFTTLFFQVLLEYCLVYIQVKQKSVTYAIISVGRLFLGLSLNIYFVVHMRLGPVGILYSGLLTSGIVGTLLLAMTFRKIGIYFSIPMLRQMLGYGLPLIFSAMSTFVITFSDRYFLNYFAPLSEVGIYSLGYKFGMLVSILVTGPFLSIWNPKRFEISKDERSDSISSKTFTYFSLATLFASLILSVLIRDILFVVAAPPFRGAAAVVPIVVLGYVFNAAYFHLNYGIYLKAKTRYIALIWLSAAALNLAANYVLIKAFQGMGAAIATALSYFYIMVATYFVAQKLHPIRFELGRVASAFALAVAICIVSFFIRSDHVALSIAMKIPFIATFPIILYVTGFLNGEEKRSIHAAVAKLRMRFWPRPSDASNG